MRLAASCTMVLAALALGPPAAFVPQAGAATQVFNVTATIQQTLDVVFGQRTITFGNLDTVQGAPKLLSSALMVTVRSNVPWVLTVTVNDDLRSVGNPANFLPAGRLAIRRTGLGTFQPVSRSSPVLVASGQPTPATGVTLTFDLQLSARFEDPPGSYQASLVYDLSPAK